MKGYIGIMENKMETSTSITIGYKLGLIGNDGIFYVGLI